MFFKKPGGMKNSSSLLSESIKKSFIKLKDVKLPYIGDTVNLDVKTVMDNSARYESLVEANSPQPQK